MTERLRSEVELNKSGQLSYIPDDAIAHATALQRMASDPDVSAWVGASAGSGKTKVLTDRMLRLMLPRPDGRPGAAPEKILALTYTKAAASEMSLRLSKLLSRWAVLENDALSKEIEYLTGRAPDLTVLAYARTLFARVLDTPGGLKIMTIHSFCQSVLARFPLEAGLSPGFKALEEEESRVLLEEAQNIVLRRARTQPGSILGTAVQILGRHLTQDSLQSLIKSILAERREMTDIVRRNFGPEALYANICTMFGIEPGLTPEDALNKFCNAAVEDENAFRAAIVALSESEKKTDFEKAQRLRNFMGAAPEARSRLYSTYKKVFLNNDGDAYKNLASSTVKKNNPDALAFLALQCSRLIAFEEEQKARRTAQGTSAVFIFVHEVMETYNDLKKVKGGVDFDDLILHTLSLFKGEKFPNIKYDSTAWVMYKLDGGIDHILLDEAQDTNPEQWEIIALLTHEFFSGQGHKTEVTRTLFVVGDEKQSIFSFQRAAPEKFEEMRNFFARKIRQAGQEFRTLDINTSFRSSQIILDAVDSVFTNMHPESKLGARYTRHRASRTGQGGSIELWPILRSDKKEQEEQTEPEGWSLPDRIVESISGSYKMAEKIGDAIHKMISSEEELHGYGRAVRAGDIMILVRSRGAFVNQMVRALKKRSIPVSGVDRMVLGEELVVHDLRALAGFSLLPEDDYTLACLLKSPFVGMSEENLLLYSNKRPGSLWESIKKTGDSVLLSWLEKLLSSPYRQKPYAFFQDVLMRPCPADAHSGMRAMRTRLGEDMLDTLDEFLNIALQFERQRRGGMHLFLYAQEHSKAEIKREMEEAGRAVRIMTVHGSKGLQAPIVFLPDTIRTSASVKPDKLIWPSKGGLSWPVYIPSVKEVPGTLSHIRQFLLEKSHEEYRRLLYVAMTRAEERLYIGGYINKRGPSEDQTVPYWYKDIWTGLSNHPRVKKIKVGNGHEEESNGDEQYGLSLFAARPLIPSRPSYAEQAARSPLQDEEPYRFQRGTVTHRLLQSLPSVPDDGSRIQAAKKYLHSVSPVLPDDVQEAILRETMGILSDPVFAHVFATNSLAEIPVTGYMRDGQILSGQIDRLAVTEHEVFIIDYKTNRPPPARLEDVPPAYKQQMQAYAEAVRQIYPNKIVRAALLWTEGPRLMEIPV